MNNLNIGDTTNRNKISRLLDLNLTGWQAFRNLLYLNPFSIL